MDGIATSPFATFRRLIKSGKLKWPEG